MLNLFGRTFRNPGQYPPTFPGPLILACRSTHSATAKTSTQSLHSLNYARNEDLYTVEEEAEIRDFLDRDLPPAVIQLEANPPTRSGENSTQAASVSAHASEYRRVKTLVRPRHRDTDNMPAQPDPTQQDENISPSTAGPSNHQRVQNLLEEEVADSGWEDVNDNEALSRATTGAKNQSIKPVLQKRDTNRPSQPLLRHERRKNFKIPIPPRTPYQPSAQLKRRPFVEMKLKVDPVGLPPSINSLLFSMGFRYQSQTLYRRRSKKIQQTMRRLWGLVSVKFLSQEEASRRKAEKRERLENEREQRILARMVLLQPLNQERKSSDGPPAAQGSGDEEG